MWIKNQCMASIAVAILTFASVFLITNTASAKPNPLPGCDTAKSGGGCCMVQRCLPEIQACFKALNLK